MREILKYVMRGRIHAMAATAGLAILTLYIGPLGLLSTAMVALVTLVHGIREGLFTALIAALVVAAFSTVMTGTPILAAEFMLKMWLPACVLAMVLYYRNLSLSLIVAAGMAGLLVGLFFVISNDPVQEWYRYITEKFLPMLEQSGLDMSVLRNNEQALQLYAHMMPAIEGTSFLYGQLISLFIARGWQAMLYRPGAFAAEFRQLRLGNSLTFALAGLALLAIVTGNDLLISLAGVGLSLFLFQGLAVCHQLIRSRTKGSAWVVALYIMMVFFMPYSLMLISLLGMTDNGVNYRVRFSGSNGNE